MRPSRWVGVVLLAAYLVQGLVRLRPPRPVSLSVRLASIPKHGLPIRDRVRIYWSDQQVPFVVAAHDEDLPVALGLVHAHLRLGQIELLRRLACGRLAELLGPVAVDVDHALRSLGLVRPVPAILAGMPTETRRWVDGFVAGINHYVMECSDLPHEFAVLGLKREAWTAADVIALGRLVGADATWLVWLRALGTTARPRSQSRLVRALLRLVKLQSLAPMLSTPTALAELLGRIGRGASNVLAAAPARSTSGVPLLGGDSHLSLMLPNLWLIAGYRSPSHHAVGLMVPGLPLLALGRNRNIAWGGANLHAASSELCDVSGLSPTAIRERRETIQVRWWRPRRLKIRETDFGPIISDVPLLRQPRSAPVALRWTGQQPSDEITAMLRVSQASNWDEFHTALAGYAVPGVHLLYADRHGHIGRRMAVQLPYRPADTNLDLIRSPASCADWARLVHGAALPQCLDPPQGYLVAANERPEPGGILIGWFFSSDDRYRRLCTLIEQEKQLSVATFMLMQRDVSNRPALVLRDHLLQLLAAEPDARRSSAVGQLLAHLRDWDGNYSAGSRGALAFELALYGLARQLIDADRLAAHVATWQSRELIARDLMGVQSAEVAPALLHALDEAATTFGRFATWGEMHRLRLDHSLFILPIIGRRYGHGDFPADGGNETVMKTAHPLTNRRHAASYGSNARYIFDLSGPDANYFVLVGGQDGWLGSSTSIDQWAFWQRGEYIRVPLQLDAVCAAFPHRTELTPKAKA